MALGDSRNSSNGNKTFDPTFYSNLKIRNYNNHLSIKIEYNKGLMKISIQKETEEQFKFEELISANLTAKKAMILVHEMDQMEQSEEDGKAYGVMVGLAETQTAIAFQIVNGVKHLRIAKIDTSNGSVKDQKAFEFQNNSDTGMHWTNFDTMKYNQDIVNDVDYVMLKTAIADFARAQSGASAYGHLYMNRYSENVLTTKVNAIMDKLGIERRSNNNNYSNVSGDIFNATSEHKSYSQINSMLSDLEGSDE